MYYYHINLKEKETKEEYEEDVISAFKESNNNYGAKKIRNELRKRDIRISKRRIRRIMEKNGLVSNYTIAQFKVHRTEVNQDKFDNELNREFNNKEENQVIVSDLTYVRVGNKWHYICILLDIFNREIVGYSAGANKDAKLVELAFMNSTIPLSNIQLFHTDRGSEFKNTNIDEILTAFNIRRSLSKPGCPYDNAVAEATYKIIKTEFIRGRKFVSLDHLKTELFDYINWYNNKRIHGSLNYLSPVEYRLNMSI
jgi:transposase InsO family protein